ncbi:MAG: prolipoprotein diacylglyceryl transferase [Proteobacteria bacterium]|nr:prolipoprotein diacylglyceryl transferase [Pseudomonadota bacterium]
MNPWLLRLDLPGIGPVAVQSYFFFLIVGCAVALEVAIRGAQRSGDDPKDVIRISVPAIVAGLIGARLGHFIFVAPDALKADPLAFLRVWEGGMVFYGGFLGGLAVVIAGCRIHKLSLIRFGDVLAGPVMVGLAFGRLGCLSNGCCYGRPIDWGTGIEWPWGVTFLRGEVPSVLRGIPLHPTQAYAALNALAIYLVIRWIRGRQRFEGEAMGLVFVAYGLSRSVIELFRLDVHRAFWFEDQLGQVLSTSQGISIPIVAVGVWLLVRGKRLGSM